MSLPHAILGFLDYQPMSGYDLKKFFDQSVAHFWSATQSHIYKALEALETEGWVESQVIQQEGKPNRKQYHITEAGKAELHRWTSTPLPVESKREAWLIQVFFAHNLGNEEIVSLFENRIERLRASLSQSQLAQEHIEKNARREGMKRMQSLWQLTLDYGANYYENEISWLEKTLPIVRQLPPLGVPKKQKVRAT